MNKIESKIIDKIEATKQIFVNASHDISANPELQNEEFYASELLTNLLATQGFSIEKDVAGHKTAFIAKKQLGDGPSICFLAEYDALPEIGHGCGHNIIGTLSSLAAVGLAEALNETGGTIYVYGTPAEEGGDNGSAKGSFADQGFFDNIDVALLLHPNANSHLTSKALSVKCYSFEFFGKTAHASSCPEDGINALDAMILFYNGVNALRQQVTSDVRIHGVITDGGTAPNVIPGYTKAKFYVRGNTKLGSKLTLDRVIKIAEGAAIATGCTYKATKFNNDVDDIVTNVEFDTLFKENASKLGLEYDFVELSSVGSSDVGNVSYKIPVIQPTLKISLEKPVGHTVEFQKACISPYADTAMVTGAKALALTGLALLQDKDKLKSIQENHKKVLAELSNN